MAFAGSTIWHNWTTGAVGSGGSFDPANINFAADLTTDANTANTASPVASSASYTFVAGDVGYHLFIQGGTNWTPGWYVIASVAGGKATLSAAVGAAVLYGTVTTGRNYHRPNGLNTVVGCATVGTPTSGVWSVDYSQNTTARLSYTDMVINGGTNTIYSSVVNPVGKNLVGNTVNVTSGTGFTVQRVQVVSTSGTNATCDKSLGTLGSTGGNGALGGAIGSTSVLTVMTQALTAGNKVYIKGTTTLTVTTTETAAVKGDTTTGRISVEGFTTYPDDGGRPTITSATNSVDLFTINDNDFFEFISLNLTHSAATRGNAFNGTTSASSPIYFKNCVVDGCLSMLAGTTQGIQIFEGCEVKNTTSATAALLSVAAITGYVGIIGCDIHDNTGPGLHINSTLTACDIERTIFDTNTIGVHLAATGSTAAVNIRDCTFVDNTADGIKLASNSVTFTLGVINSIFYGNLEGINNDDGQTETDGNMRVMRNNAFGSNTTAPYSGIKGGEGEITLSGDPFTSRVSRIFTPNNTVGAGALLRGAAFPSTIAGKTNYRDVGAMQHQEIDTTSYTFGG